MIALDSAPDRRLARVRDDSANPLGSNRRLREQKSPELFELARAAQPGTRRIISTRGRRTWARFSSCSALLNSSTVFYWRLPTLCGSHRTWVLPTTTFAH